jgi:DNA replication and repair protein RecF
MWVETLDVENVRNIRRAEIELGPGLNVFWGRNAQGKTSLLEAVALLARGRSFRTDDTASVIRAGEENLRSRGRARGLPAGPRQLEVVVGRRGRSFCLDGRGVSAREYLGNLEAAVYSTDRLRVVRGPMRERRLFLDRAAAALWPSYREALREFERVLAQRNAALERGGADLPAWTDRFVALGAALRQRRGRYVQRLAAALPPAGRAPGEVYGLALRPAPAPTEVEEAAQLARALRQDATAEHRRRATLSGPHRDAVALTVDGEDASRHASSGQVRSLILALVLATLEVYREETGVWAVVLLDDLDSELDEERATDLCRTVSARGQALVTTAHPGWATRLGGWGRLFAVEAGQVRAA